MDLPLDHVRSINAQKCDWRIKVRIIRLWVAPIVNHPMIPESVNMVLMDEDGDKIEATIRQAMAYNYLPQVVEGGVYTIFYFNVKRNTSACRLTDHPYRLIFPFKTTITPAVFHVIPSHGFSFSCFYDIMNSDPSKNSVVDVIGLLIGISEESEVEVHGKFVKRVMIELYANSHRIKCVLLGVYVDYLNAFIGSGEYQQPAVLIQYGQVAKSNGEVVIKNLPYATKIQFNPLEVDISVLRNSLLDQDLILNESFWAKSHLLKLSLEVDFLHQTPPATIEDLRTNREDGFFIVKATIMEIVKQSDWIITVCQCSKPVMTDSGHYFCPSCGLHAVHVSSSFIVKVHAADSTGCATFFVIDPDLHLMLDVNSDYISANIQQFCQGRRSLKFPDIFDSLVGTELLFKVETMSNACPECYFSFNAVRVCNDQSILTKFDTARCFSTPHKSIFAPPFPELFDPEVDAMAVKCESDEIVGYPQKKNVLDFV